MVVLLWWCGGVSWFTCKDFSYITSRLGRFQLYNFSLFHGGVFVVVFVWWSLCGGVLVVVFLWWSLCGGLCVVVCVFVVLFLWWCFCGGVLVVVFL